MSRQIRINDEIANFQRVLLRGWDDFLTSIQGFGFMV